MIESFRYAADGIRHCLRSQPNTRLAFGIAAVVVLVSALLRLSAVEFALVLSAIFAVLVTELVNTAVEATVDLVTRDRHPVAAIAKDAAAGAVLLACVYAAAVGGAIFFSPERLGGLFQLPVLHGPERLTDVQYALLGMALLLLVILVIKERGKEGRFLRGGVISGHAALGFYAATVILLTVQNKALGLLALVPALLLAQSRVEGRIHSLREVVAGSVVGVALATVVLLVGAAIG